MTSKADKTTNSSHFPPQLKGPRKILSAVSVGSFRHHHDLKITAQDFLREVRKAHKALILVEYERQHDNPKPEEQLEGQTFKKALEDRHITVATLPHKLESQLLKKSQEHLKDNSDLAHNIHAQKQLGGILLKYTETSTKTVSHHSEHLWHHLPLFFAKDKIHNKPSNYEQSHCQIPEEKMDKCFKDFSKKLTEFSRATANNSRQR